MGSSKQVKQLDTGMIITAFALSAIIFGAGVFVGYMMNREKLSAMETSISEIVSDIENFQLQFLSFDVLGENATCPLLESTLAAINKKSYETGNRLELGLSEMGGDASYVSTKLEYSRLLVSYWLLAEKLKAACETKVSTVIYFYAKDCSLCSDQAFVLTYMKNNYGSRLLVFALDADLGEPSVNTLKSYYNVTIYPSLIINGLKHEGLVSQQQLEDTLNLGVVVGG